MTPQAKARLKTAAKAAVTLGLLALTLRLIHFGTLAESLRRADGALLLVSAGILVAGGFAGAASWYCVLRTRLPGFSYRAVAGCHWSGMFFNSFLPSNVGGDVVKGYIAARDQGQTAFVVTSLLVDRALNLGILLGMGLFALLLLEGDRAWAAAFLALLGAGALAVPAAARRLHARVGRWPQGGRRGRVARVLDPVFVLLSSPRLFFPALAAAFASQFLKTLNNVFLILALGLQIPLACVWYVIPLFGIVSGLPLSIGGLGLREMVAHGISGPMHIDNTHLVTLSLAGHVMVVLVNMLGAVPFLLRRRRQARR